VSAAEAEAEEEPVDATEGEQADPDDGRPAINEEEMADLDAVREEVADETTPPDSNDEQESDDDAESDQTADTGGDDTEALDPDGDTVGDLYVNALVSTSNMLIEEHGREDADPIDEQPLRQFGVDDAVDKLMADNGGPDLPPEHQVLIGTAFFAVVVLGTKTTLIEDALENADFSLQ
jgi:hypothetical protein